jgi:mono/diheme cytochrome c family protein
MKIRLLLALEGSAIGFAAPSLAQQQNTVDPEVHQQIEAVLMKFFAAFFGFFALTSASPSCASADDEVARGKYIVENVAKCTECHSPRGQNEEPAKGLSLSGAKLEFTPITPNASWAESAPDIRGIKGYNEEAAVTLFSRGIAKNYGELAPPMPSYKMTEDDADAVYKYLKSLEP